MLNRYVWFKHAASKRLLTQETSSIAFRLAAAAALLLCGGLMGRWLVPTGTGVSEEHRVASSYIVTEGGIPCIVHQTWKAQELLSALAKRWRDSWSRCLPDCRHILWTDEDNRRLIGMHFPWLLPTYECMKSGAQKSDLAKYAYLLHYGGIYADLDTVCLKDFRPLLRQSALVFGGMEGRWMRSVNGTYVQNSLMASRPEHKFWLVLLKRIVATHRESKVSWPASSEPTTGSLVLMEELQLYLDDGRTDASVFPPGYFNPFSSIAGVSSSAKKNDKAENCRTNGVMNEDQERPVWRPTPGPTLCTCTATVGAAAKSD